MAYNSISFSGGKDSTAMLLMMLERGEQVDEVLFFNTGWEFPEMLEHIALVEKRTGLHVTRLKPDRPFDYWAFEHELSRGRHKGQMGYGFARPNARWCTAIKTRAIDRHKREQQRNGLEVVTCIGIAADEPKRQRERVRALSARRVGSHGKRSA